VLFSGDTPIRGLSQDVTYDEVFCEFLDNLNLKVIYSGHDKPLIENVKEVLLESFRLVSGKNRLQVFH